VATICEYIKREIPPEWDTMMIRELIAEEARCPQCFVLQKNKNWDRWVCPSPTGWSALHWSRQGEYPWVLRNLSGLPKTSSILDVGGGCTLDRFLARHVDSLTVVDTDPKALTHFQATAELQNIKTMQFIQGDARDLPIPDDVFDIVLSVSVIEHIPGSCATCFAELVRVCKPGGLVLCTMDVLLRTDAADRDDNFCVGRATASALLQQWKVPIPNPTMNPLGAYLKKEDCQIMPIMIRYEKPVTGGVG
jgi:ubiquinone/menaquinone biosynthesis C-methylase UbiE